MFKAYQNFINQTRISFLELFRVEEKLEFKNYKPICIVITNPDDRQNYNFKILKD